MAVDGSAVWAVDRTVTQGDERMAGSILRVLGLVAAAFGLAVSSAPVEAQWTVTRLNPAGLPQSMVYAASGGQQAGIAVVGGSWHASLWSGTAGSWVDLHPASANSNQSAVSAMADGQQVGWASVGAPNGPAHASLWSGTAASWVDLHPGTSQTMSWAYANFGGQQVGTVAYNAQFRAGMWSGNAASYVELHPAGATSSEARGIDKGLQAGWVVIGGVQRASIWTGTAASWTDLSPAGTTGSGITDAADGQQVGVAVLDGVQRASLWRGTAASWVDLRPKGATQSGSYGVANGRQVGYAVVGGVTRASLWSGTAASWVDLSTFLPWEFTSSSAYGISSDGVTLYVAGVGGNSITNRSEALLWSRPLPTCGADIDCDGGVNSADLGALLSAWGTPGPADIDQSGAADSLDLAILLSAWTE
jgi:hypothetical protein